MSNRLKTSIHPNRAVPTVAGSFKVSLFNFFPFLKNENPLLNNHLKPWKSVWENTCHLLHYMWSMSILEIVAVCELEVNTDACQWFKVFMWHHDVIWWHHYRLGQLCMYRGQGQLSTRGTPILCWIATQKGSNFMLGHKIYKWGIIGNFTVFLLFSCRISQTQPGWPHSSQDKIPCVFPVLDNFSLCYFYVINNS